MKLLNVEQVSHSFGITEVLKKVNLKIKSGQVVALVGPSGCGKTTLLHLCAGLLNLTSGHISSNFESTAFMFQEPRLLPWKNAIDNIALGLKARKVAKKKIERISTEIGLTMGLATDDLDKFPHELSGGMQQRVALARALVLQPDLLLLDEPFSALDIGLKTELYGLLIEQFIQHNAAVLMITHDLMEAVRLSDRILLMESNPGRIVKEFFLDKNISERDDSWVYQTTAELIQTKEVRRSFALTPTVSA